MTTAEIIISVFVFALAGLLIFLSVRSFLQKGFVFNNAYILASETERERMNKKPYYRQTAIVFCLLSIVFIIIGLSVILKNYQLALSEIPVIAILLIYVIASTIRIGRQNKH